MATTQKDNDQAAQEFGDAFNEEAAPVEAGMADGEALDPADYELPMEGDAEEPAPAAPQEMAPEPMAADPKEAQRMRSWEGRLKAREAELKAREMALAEGGGTASSPAEAVEEALEDVESGDMTAQEAMQSLAEDFGEDFARLISVILESKAREVAGSVADERVGKMQSAVDQIISDITDDRVRAHFEKIVEAHPDFLELAESDALSAYIASMPEEDRAKAQQVVDTGSAAQIIGLLSAVKSWAGMRKGEEGDGMDAAEGVRSRGLSIPDKPSRSDDFSAAWNEF